MAKNISWEHIESYPIRNTLDGWDEEYSSVDEFKQHLTADFLSSEKSIMGWVFWTEYSSGDHESSSKVFRRSITEKITHVLRKIASKWWSSCDHMLVQFWAEEEVEGRCCLATLHQPFAVFHFPTKGVSWVRKICMQHYYYTADEDQLGPPGRVFRNGNPESSPDILLYSTKEFPLRDLVTGCGLKSYLAIPIFDVIHNQCVGVLEFICKERVKYYVPPYWSKVVDDALQEVGLRLGHKYGIPFGQRVKVYRLNEDGTWDDRGTGHVTVDYLERSEDQGLFVIDEDSEPLLLHRISSDGIYRKEEDTIISWRDPESSYTEFALSFQETTGCSYIWDHIRSVQRNMHFSSLTGFTNATQLNEKKFGVQCKHPLGFENVQYGHETEQQYSKNQIDFSGIDDARIIDQEQERNIVDAINVEDEAHNTVDVNFEDETERDGSSTSFHVSYDQLKSQFGKSRKDAAKNLGVSISTFKRKCRDYGINRWPSKMNNIKNPSLFRSKVANKCAENADHQTSKPSGCDLTTSDYPVEPNISSPPIQKTMDLANTSQVADMEIKAKFKDDTIRFDFCDSWGVEKLMEEVSRRLYLKIGEFKLKYVDDEGELILLACDDDLHSYVKSTKSLGKTIARVSVHLVSD